MPNYCENTLKIRSKDIKKIRELVDKIVSKEEDGSEYLNFDRIIPEPRTQEECERDYPDYVIHNEEEAKKHHLGYEGERNWFNWYDWHVKYWGTKWNSCDTNVGTEGIVNIGKEKYHQATIFFTTAWSPAIPVIEKLIDENDSEELLFDYSYYESGEFFAGTITWNSGNKEYEYYEAEDRDEVVRIAKEEDYDDCAWLEEEDEY